MANQLKSRLSVVFLFHFLSWDLYAASHDISINYLNSGKMPATISVECTEHNGVCQSTLIFFPNNQDKISEPRAMNAQGLFHPGNDGLSKIGAITVRKDNKETQLPISLDYQELPSVYKENVVIQALITHLHPALINHACKELDQVTEISDYLIGTSKNSDTLHLFKPKIHTLSSKDITDLSAAINGEFLVLDIGSSYSMVLVFAADNTPLSVYVLDRWKLYRNQAFKTVIGYGDLAGLVLHGVDFLEHSSTAVGLGDHNHSSVLERVVSLVGAGFHIAEIIDHSQGVGEFIGNGQKHYQDHDHGLWANIFGVMHLGHTFFELATDHSLSHGIQSALALASFAYHHVPHHYYEYPLSQVIQTVTHR